MKRYTIYLWDKIQNVTEKIKQVNMRSKIDLQAELLDLQQNYCEGEKPTISYLMSGELVYAVAESDADFCYISIIGNRKELLI